MNYKIANLPKAERNSAKAKIKRLQADITLGTYHVSSLKNQLAYTEQILKKNKESLAELCKFWDIKP